MKALITRIAVSSVLLVTATGIAQAKTELKMGHTGAPSHHYQTISQQFADEVAKRTNGELTISVFPSDQLGNQLESVEGTMIGTHDMVLASDTVLSNWVPDMGIFNLPFLFETQDEYLAAANSDIGNQLNEQLKGQGAAVIGWWANGFRHVTNSKRAIKTPDDLKGLTIRVPEGQVFVDTFRSMGAAPTVMSFGELYSALQLRTIDGQENPPAHIVTQNFNEVQKYLSRTGHIHMASPLIINLNLLERLPENQRTILLETAKEFGQRHADMVTAQEADQWKELANRGMEIIDVEKAPFRAAVQPVYDNAGKRMDSKLIKQTEDFLAKKRSE